MHLSGTFHHYFHLLGIVFSGMIMAVGLRLAAAFVSKGVSCTSSCSDLVILTQTWAPYRACVLDSRRDVDFDPQLSASASDHNPYYPTKQKKREAIISILRNRSQDNSLSRISSPRTLQPEWYKLRNYLYQTNLSNLLLSQVESVISYLDSILESTELTNTVIQNTPRILRKSVKTQLMPTVEFLQSIYPKDLFLEAVERKPNLLVTSGVGYNAEAKNDSNDAEQYLLKELGFGEKIVAKLKKSTPVIFQFSVSEQIGPVVEYLVSILDDKERATDAGSAAVRVEAMAAVGKMIRSYPTVLGLSVETNLKPTTKFLWNRCGFDKNSMAKILKSYPEFLGLSLETNLRPKIDYLSNVLLQYRRDDLLPEDEVEEEYGLWLEDARSLLRSCIIKHPPILGLSIDNLREKVAYFDALDCVVSVGAALRMMEEGSIGSSSHETTTNSERIRGENKAAASLAGRILLAAPSAYSLSLRNNIIPTVECVAKFWGTEINALIDSDAGDAIRDENGCLLKPLPSRSNVLSTQLCEYPVVLTLSVEGNLRPTIEFYNKTGYVRLDSEGRLLSNKDDTGSKEDSNGSSTVRGRYLATSLFNRLLPRWHYFKKKTEANTTSTNSAAVLDDPLCNIDGTTIDDEQCNQEEMRPPLHVLAGSSDQRFCKNCGFDLADYEKYRREEGDKLKFNLQFANWIKTGRPID